MPCNTFTSVLGPAAAIYAAFVFLYGHRCPWLQVDKAQDAGPQSPLSFSSHSHSVPIPNADDSDPDSGNQDGGDPKFGGIDGGDQK
jgi:hypothetical protein